MGARQLGTIPHRQYVHPAGARQQDGPQPMADGHDYALCETLVLAQSGHAGAYARQPIRRPKSLRLRLLQCNFQIYVCTIYFLFSISNVYTKTIDVPICKHILKQIFNIQFPSNEYYVLSFILHWETTPMSTY